MTHPNNIEYYTTAVTLGDLKNSMLYFDHIIPVALPIDFLKEITNRDINSLSEILKKVGNEIFPKDLIENKDFADSLATLTLSA